MAYNPFHKNAYLGNGQYDQLEVLRKSKDPLINYEGLYEDAPSNIATSNIFKAMQPEFEYRNPNFLEHAERKGMVDLAGNVPMDRDRRIDFARYWSDSPLYSRRSKARFEDFSPRVGQPLGYQEDEYSEEEYSNIVEKAKAINARAKELQKEYPYQEIDIASLRDPFTNTWGNEESETISTPVYQDRIMNRNLPGFAYESPKGLASIINSQLRNAKTNVGQKVGKGWDLAKQLPGMAMSALTGIPGIGALMGMLPKTSPEQKAMMDLYNSEDYQNLLNQIPGMANYNPVYGMGSGYGLTNAINKRLATLAKTRKRQGDDFSATLRKREEDLKKLLALEAEKDFARIGASGRRPGTSGGAYSGEHRDSQSRGQASAGNTGGYSYDSGGREGYGYGLKYGGRVGYANGGLASLFTRRG